MALVAKSDPERNLRERQIGLSEKLLRSFQPLLYQIEVRRRPNRLLECSSKMPLGQPSDTGKCLQFDVLLQALLDIFAYADQCPGCQAPYRAVWKRRSAKEPNRLEARPGV